MDVSQQPWQHSQQPSAPKSPKPRRFGPAVWVGLGILVVFAFIGVASGGIGGVLATVGLFVGGTALWHVIAGHSWASPLIPVGRGKAAIGIPVAFGVMMAGAVIWLFIPAVGPG